MNNKYYFETGRTVRAYCADDLSLYSKVIRYLKKHKKTIATDKIVKKCAKSKKEKLRCSDGEFLYKKCRRFGLNYRVVLYRYYSKDHDIDSALNWFLSGQARKHLKINDFKNAAEYCKANNLDYQRFIRTYRKNGGDLQAATKYAAQPVKRYKKHEKNL